MLLLTPGPTPVPESIRKVMAEETIHHRTPEFEEIFKNTRTKLLKLFNMPEAVMLASSGTGAMEAAVTNLCSQKLLFINAGKFGERFGKIATSFKLETKELKYEWNTPANIEDIIEIIKNDDTIDAVAIQISESAGGLRHPVEEIAKKIKEINKDIMIIADGITAVGVEKIDTKNIDALIAGSQKAFMLPPGLSMIGLSNDAVSKIEQNAKGYYFNLASEIKKQKTNTTAYTAPTTLIIGLNEFLTQVEELGEDNLYKNTKNRHQATTKALKAIGFKIFPKTSSLAMNTVLDENAAKIRKILKTKYDVNIAGGQDEYKTKLFRINNMGFIKPYETAWTLNSLELALDELDIRKYDGLANRVFNEEFWNN